MYVLLPLHTISQMNIIWFICIFYSRLLFYFICIFRVQDKVEVHKNAPPPPPHKKKNEKNVFKKRQTFSHSTSEAFPSLARFRCTQERFYLNQVRSLLSMRCMLLGYSFNPGLITVHLVKQLGRDHQLCQ